MRKVLIALIIAFSVTTFAQKTTKSKKTTVPINIKEGFAKEFPKQNAKWRVEDDGFQVEFKLNGRNI